jgi:hypothetical protein
MILIQNTMKILLVHKGQVPVFAYGGTERVLWDLAKGLVEMGHQPLLMVNPGSHCDFAEVLEIKPNQSLQAQVESVSADVIHFQFRPDFETLHPHIITEHGNTKHPTPLSLNTVFVSADHARRYGASAYVHNGLNWSDYGDVNWQRQRTHLHFLGKGSWPVKNLRGAIDVARMAKQRLEVLGGNRLNLSRGFRFTPWPSIRFNGMVGGREKIDLLNGSKGMIFPIRWHEPFGLAVIESLYFGCPVFASPFGALPEIVDQHCGYLSPKGGALAHALQEMRFDPMQCHERARDVFNHRNMAEGYLSMYRRVMAGGSLNQKPPVLPENGHRLLDWSL